jgi:hypothetical protein
LPLQGECTPFSADIEFDTDAATEARASPKRLKDNDNAPAFTTREAQRMVLEWDADAMLPIEPGMHRRRAPYVCPPCAQEQAAQRCVRSAGQFGTLDAIGVVRVGIDMRQDPCVREALEAVPLPCPVSVSFRKSKPAQMVIGLGAGGAVVVGVARLDEQGSCVPVSAAVSNVRAGPVWLMRRAFSAGQHVVPCLMRLVGRGEAVLQGAIHWEFPGRCAPPLSLST